MPNIIAHAQYWVQYDIKKLDELTRLFVEFKPTHVIHLAAKANLDGNSIHDFPDNIIGTKNVAQCVNETITTVLFVHTSSQYAVMPGVFPESDEFLQSYTAYGESKAESELIIPKLCSKPWIILRPTNI